MARIKTTAFSPDFSALVNETNAIGEHNDCSVKAIALVTGRSYREAHAALKVAGRRDRGRTPIRVSAAAIRGLGATLRVWTDMEMFRMMDSYPGADVHNNRRAITTHHWRRFATQWAPHRGKKLIIVTNGHMLAVIDGEVKDWSVNRSLRVREIWEVA